MAVGRWLKRGTMAVLVASLLLVAPSRSLEPVFSNEDSGATREIKVCILLLQATSWENPEPFFLPTLASDAFQRVRNLRPANWSLVNPLAPTVVTPAIEALWNKQTGSSSPGDPVIFDGVSALVDNDYADNGNDTAAEVNVNQGHYNGSGANPGGPNTYLSHCQPVHLNQYGTNGTSSTLALPALGQPIPKNHPAYWEVPLTPVTVSQLTNFDAVFVNTHRNIKFTDQEQTLLRQFLDQGGTLYLEDSHGSRLAVVSGGDPELPQDVDFFLPFQFVDGYPTFGSAPPNRPDGFPLNRGGVSTLTPSKTVVAQDHPLLNALHPITDAEADRIGDVRARDHLIMRSSPAIYRVEEVLRTTNTDTEWGDPNDDGVLEPAIAVARVGSGKLVLSGVDAIDDCSKPYETGTEPDSNILPDIKFMFNLLAWRGSTGGDRRGGANNLGVAASEPVRSLNPKYLWHHPSTWSGTAADFANIDAVDEDVDRIREDDNFTLSEPLTAASGVVYVQYEYHGEYWLVAIDSEPEEDRDGDGNADDGIRDMTNFGSTSDTIWRRNFGALPLSGATVVSVQHEEKNVPIDVLLVSQWYDDTTVRIHAIHATLDDAINDDMSPVETEGGPFYNWTDAAPNYTTGTVGWVTKGDGYVQIALQGEMPAVPHQQISPPRVLDDLVYFTAATNLSRLEGFGPGSTEPVPPGEYVELGAVRLVPDPSSGAEAGAPEWRYPDRTYTAEVPPDGASIPVDETYRLQLMRQTDLLQDIAYWDHDNTGDPDPAYPQADGRFQYINPDTASTQQEAAFTSTTDSGAVVPTMRDSTHLMPVIGRVRDERTGLTSPTVFINRSNGDLWAVASSRDAMGWRIEGTIAINSILVGGTDETARFVPEPVMEYDAAAGTDVQVATDLMIADNATDIAWYRDLDFFTPVNLTYTRDGNLVNEEVKIYPRHRLLRADRDSGYETGDLGKISLNAWSTGAPILLDEQTIASTSSALWLGAHEPSATYEDGSDADRGVGRATSGDLTPNGYEIRGSGPVTFFRAGGDAIREGEANQNDYSAIRWVFDPSVAVGVTDVESQFDVMDTAIEAPTSPLARPGNRPVVSVYGSSVKYGSTVVVAGTVDDDRGIIMGIDPNPSFAAATGPLDRRTPTYLLPFDPAQGALGDSLFDSAHPIVPYDDNALAGYTDPSNYSTKPLRHYVIDPDQYSLDYTMGRLELKANTAHMMRLEHPMPDSAADGREPFPEAVRWPLYGRNLYLVFDNNHNGVYDDGDGRQVIYVPSPVRWLYYQDTILLDARACVVRDSVTVTPVTGSGAVAFVVDELRPLVRITDTAYRGDEVYVSYQTTDGVTHTERHVVPEPLPGLQFSPVVAGTKIYVSGTQMGSQASTPVPTYDFDGDGVNDNGGLYAFRFGARDHVVEMQSLQPDTVPTWPNFQPTALARQLVRGIPLALDGEAFASFLMQGVDGADDSQRVIAPLYALGGSELLVTETQRLAKVDYEGRVLTQITGTKEKDAPARQADLVTNNPQATDLLTTPLVRPSRAYNLPGDKVLLVDTGNDRVVEVDKTGLVTWPLDSRTGYPDTVLRYLGLRDLGLNRPRDAFRIRVNGLVHPQSDYDVDGDNTVGDADDQVTKDVTVIADTGNRRVVQVVSYSAGPRFYDLRNVQSGTYTYYEPLAATQTGFGGPWVLTAPQVYNPTTEKWVELAYTQVQVWDPQSGDNDGRHDASNETLDFYYVARVEGSDQLFNLDPDSDNGGNISNNGNLDDDGDGEVDGIQRNMANLLDGWSGGMVFRGLRAFHRFRVAGVPYLAIIQQDPNAAAGQSQVVIYEHVGGTPPIVARWAFTVTDYATEVYDPSGTNSDAYYTRAGISAALRNRWYGLTGTKKPFNPVSVTKLPNQNRLAIVNGSANSVNQTASNSEVLIVEFDPNDLTSHRVEHVLPDLATTTTYPAGQAASQRRPETGSYPISSPVHVDQ